MKKRLGLSNTGYAIVGVITLAVVMILSAPMFVNSYGKKASPSNQPLESRVEELERHEESLSNKYVCTLEGSLDENGIVVPSNSEKATGKFVFVCEYKE